MDGSLTRISWPATTERAAYVAGTRGREQALFFTDDRNELLRVMGREDEPLSAMDISESGTKEAGLPPQARHRSGMNFGNMSQSRRQNLIAASITLQSLNEKGHEHDG